MSATPSLFSFVQVELPWQLGPPDGRYLLRPPDAPGGGPSHVIVLATLGAPERRRLTGRRPRDAPPGPEPTPVTTARATVIDVGSPLTSEAEGGEWLQRVGEAELEAGLRVLNRALHAFRLVTADPYVNTVGRTQALVARVGYGAGEQVADGEWSSARELPAPRERQRRARVLQAQALLAAMLGARERPLACEELALRARLDLDQGRDREAALQLLVALDAALAELRSDTQGAALSERLNELRSRREAVAGAAQRALSGPLSPTQRETVETTLGRIEAALRARAVANT